MVEIELKKVGRENVHEACASNIYTAHVATNFGYYATKRGNNILEDVYFCLKCKLFVLNKQRSGTNPFIRHCDKSCPVSFVDLSKDIFAKTMTDCLNLVGAGITKTDVQKKLVELGRITDKNAHEVTRKLEQLLHIFGPPNNAISQKAISTQLPVKTKALLKEYSHPIIGGNVAKESQNETIVNKPKVAGPQSSRTAIKTVKGNKNSPTDEVQDRPEAKDDENLIPSKKIKIEPEFENMDMYQDDEIQILRKNPFALLKSP